MNCGSNIKYPASEAFLALIQEELVWAQILIRHREQGYEIRHVADRSRSSEELRVVPWSEARQLAQFTSAGAFRPLKSAPDLQSGWRIEVRDESELEFAIDRLYPGSIADWHAAQSSNPPVTNYREFTDRQTGMYRITTKLNDAQAAQVMRACCHESLCLKRRIWLVTGLEPDPPATKSAIPCLEPCAVLLELARKAMRLEQEEKMNLPLGPGELATLVVALERALGHSGAILRENDMDALANPRRLRLLLERIRVKVQPNVTRETE